MISIIICSKSKADLSRILTNIKETVGVSHEIIIIDNVNNDYTISQAYNIGITRSKFGILCFVHEDVLFHTSNWGKVIIRQFDADPNVGCIGVAGADYKTKAPSAWWDAKEESWALNIIQHKIGKSPNLECIGWSDDEVTREVAVLDGVFIAIRKLPQFKFDEEIGSFHGYDLNISLEVRKLRLKIVVAKEILLEHFSSGKINAEWVMAIHRFHKKYRNTLPVTISENRPTKNEELFQLERFIDLALEYDLKAIAITHWFEFFFQKPIAKAHFKFVKRMLKTAYN